VRFFPLQRVAVIVFFSCRDGFLLITNGEMGVHHIMDLSAVVDLPASKLGLLLSIEKIPIAGSFICCVSLLLDSVIFNTPD
jgi:hypothetical protein